MVKELQQRIKINLILTRLLTPAIRKSALSDEYETSKPLNIRNPWLNIDKLRKWEPNTYIRNDETSIQKPCSKRN